jgi:hypothetical protein
MSRTSFITGDHGCFFEAWPAKSRLRAKLPTLQNSLGTPDTRAGGNREREYSKALICYAIAACDDIGIFIGAGAIRCVPA